MDFNLDTTYVYNKDIHKSKIIKYKPNNLATMNTVNTNINIILNREEDHLNLRDSYLEIEFVVSDDAGGVFANDANIRLVNYGMMALFSSIKLETSGGRTNEYIDHCHPNLLMYKLLNSTGDEYESGFVRNQGNRDSQLKGDHIAAQRGHTYMMIKMSDLFGFENDLEKIIYGLELYIELMLILVQLLMMVISKLEIYHGVCIVLILVMIIELLCKRV